MSKFLRYNFDTLSVILKASHFTGNPNTAGYTISFGIETYKYVYTASIFNSYVVVSHLQTRLKNVAVSHLTKLVKQS